MLVLSLRIGDRISTSDGTIFEIVENRGQVIRVGIHAKDETEIKKIEKPRDQKTKTPKVDRPIVPTVPSPVAGMSVRKMIQDRNKAKAS